MTVVTVHSCMYTDKLHYSQIDPQIMHSGSKLFRCSIRCQLYAWPRPQSLEAGRMTGSVGRLSRGRVETRSTTQDVCIVSSIDIRVDGKRSAIIWQLTGSENAKYYLVDSNSVLCEADSWQIAGSFNWKP